MSVPDENPVAAPSHELGNDRPDVHAAVAGAVQALANAPERGADGRFVPGTPAAVTTGAESEQLAELLEPARRAIVERTIAGLGVDADDLSEPLARLVGAFAEVSVLRESVFARMALTGGPVSNRGKLRALFTALLALADRELRLAQALGLERRPRDTDDLAISLARAREDR